MALTLQIIIGLVAMICLAGGLNILIKGAGFFLPKELDRQKVLDNLVRFLSGIYFSLGFLLIYVLLHIPEMGGLIYFVGLVVICSGLGRLISRLVVGSAGAYFDYVMILEVLLGISIIVLQYLS